MTSGEPLGPAPQRTQLTPASKGVTSPLGAWSHAVLRRTWPRGVRTRQGRGVAAHPREADSGHWRLTQYGPVPESGGGGGNTQLLPASHAGGGVPTGAHWPEMHTCWSPQSIALVQLGGAQTWCVLQLAPGAQALLLLQGLPTGVHWPEMQLLPASQSADREHWGIFAHAPLMQVAPELQSEFCVQRGSVVPEQLQAGSAAIAREDRATRRSPGSRRRTGQRFPQFSRSQYPANACEVE